MKEKKEVAVVDFGNPFSFRGRSGRLDYLVYGVLLPYTLGGLGLYLGMQTETPVFIYVAIVIALVISLATTVRRARDREENIFLVFFLAMFPYINVIIMLYLLLAPGKNRAVPEAAPAEMKKVTDA